MKRKNSIKIWSIVATSLLLQSCSDNPLIGKWVLESGSNSRTLFLCKNVEYTPKEEICDGIVIPIEYDVRGDQVLIKSGAESFLSGFGVSVDIESRNRISVVNPIDGKRIYYVRKGSQSSAVKQPVKHNPSVVKTLLRSYTKAELQESCEKGIRGAIESSKGDMDKAESALASVCYAAKVKR